MKKAFTLLETLVSITILSSFLILLWQTQTAGIQFTAKSRTLDRVQQVALQEILKIERNYSLYAYRTLRGEYPEEHDLSGFTWDIVARDDVVLGVIPVHRIEVIITWPESSQNPRTYSLSLLGPANIGSSLSDLEDSL